MFKRGRRKYLILVGFVLALLIATVLLDSLVLEPYAIFLDTTTLTIPDPRLPPGESIKLLHLTDLHVSTYGFREMRVIQVVKSLKPDVVVLTGDYISSRDGLPGLQKFLGSLRSAVGGVPVLYILGNWDYWSGVPREVVKLFKRYKARLLSDSYVILSIRGVEVAFAGFDSFTGRYSLPNFTILEDIPNKYPIIVLLHEPALSKYIVKYREDVTLILAGHCHGGQVKLFDTALFLPEGCEGCYEGRCRVGNVVIYVSRGVGTSLFPIRFSSPPEVVLIYLVGLD